MHFWYADVNGVVWQDQFVICGVIGLVVAAIAVAGLRELSPRLRDQLMVSLRDRVLVEARTTGLDLEASLRHPWRQMLYPDIVGSALAISLFLVAYYTLIGFASCTSSSSFGSARRRPTASATGHGRSTPAPWCWSACCRTGCEFGSH